MVLKKVYTAIICTALWSWSSVSMADEYRPDDFLGLDLSKAVLSLKPLGPPSEFVPVPVEARTDRESAQARAEPQAEPKIVTPKTKVVVPKTRVAHSGTRRPRAAPRTKLARRHSNPLDAQAFDTRVQVWPCKSGGICNWKR
jgi:hypothetical protein